jgi:integration host factor subunit beta
MTKADLVEQVTASIARTAGPMISKKDCARVVDAFLEAVKEALKQQHNIEVRGFGTFKIRRRKTRMARNPRTGDPVESPRARFPCSSPVRSCGPWWRMRRHRKRSRRKACSRGINPSARSPGGAPGDFFCGCVSAGPVLAVTSSDGRRYRFYPYDSSAALRQLCGETGHRWS